MIASYRLPTHRRDPIRIFLKLSFLFLNRNFVCRGRYEENGMNQRRSAHVRDDTVVCLLCQVPQYYPEQRLSTLRIGRKLVNTWPVPRQFPLSFQAREVQLKVLRTHLRFHCHKHFTRPLPPGRQGPSIVST